MTQMLFFLIFRVANSLFELVPGQTVETVSRSQGMKIQLLLVSVVTTLLYAPTLIEAGK